MANNRVRAGSVYIYHANNLDRWDGRTRLVNGEPVRVVNRHGCPPANTMGHAFVENLDDHDKRGGLVHTNSLHTRAEYVAYLRERIAAHKDNPVNQNAIVEGRR